MHRKFFIDFEIGDSQRVELVDKDLLHQLISVFRAKLGDEIILLDNSGFEFKGMIKGIGKEEVLVNIIDKTKKEDVKVGVSVFQSLIKKDNVELVLEKCTETGVVRFVPILAERSVKSNLNFERLNKIAKEASEQSGRVKMPQISEIIGFKKAVSMSSEEKDVVNFIFHEESDYCCDRLSCAFLQHFKDVKKINIFIGPEGGFSDEEVELAKKGGFYVLSLGDLVLRSETAAIVSSFFLINK